MKKIIALFAIVSVFGFVACENAAKTKDAVSDGIENAADAAGELADDAADAAGDAADATEPPSHPLPLLSYIYIYYYYIHHIIFVVLVAEGWPHKISLSFSNNFFYFFCGGGRPQIESPPPFSLSFFFITFTFSNHTYSY